MQMNLKDAWEARAKNFQDKKESVMQQSLPSLINEFIHNVHLQEVLNNLPKDNCICLDVGCGYGRIALEVVNRNKNLFVCGIDISKTFIDFFNEKLGKRGRGVVGNMRKIPFKDNKFDYIYCIVSLMYLDTKKDQRMGMAEIMRVLKPGGRVLLIEPNTTGNNIMKLFGILPFILRKVLKRKKIETFGISFEYNAIDRLVKESGGRIIEKKGYPIFTIFFLPLLALSKAFPALARSMLNIINRVDGKVSIPVLSNVIVYLIEKPER